MDSRQHTVMAGFICILCSACSLGLAEADASIVQQDGLATGPAKDGETVSFCDYWPLAPGNRWEWFGGFDNEATWEVDYRFLANGCDVWLIRDETTTFGGTELTERYWVFSNGWLYETVTPDDLDALPSITGDFEPLFPEEIPIGQPFVLPFCLDIEVTAQLGSLSDLLPPGTDLSAYATGQHDDCVGLGPIILGRGVGPITRYLVLDLKAYSIEGGCADVKAGEFTFAETPCGGWFESGGRLELSVMPEGTQGYVWYNWKKDGEYVPGGNGPTFVIESLAPEDSGTYTCLVSDEVTGVLESPGAQVAVFAEGSLPGAGLGALAACAGVCLVAGVRRLRRRRLED